MVWLLLLPLCLWTVGLHAVDISRILVFVTLLILLVPRWRPYFFVPLELSKWQERILLTYLCFYPLLISLQHIVRLYNGGHGVDTLTFVQTLQSFAEGKALTSSIVDLDKIHFLKHHFSPVLYVPAALTFLHIPAHISLFIVGFICVSLTLAFSYMFLRSLDYNKALALLGTALLAANYNFRHSIGWTYRPETMVYPFLVLGMYFWIKQRHWLVALCLLATFTAKETFFIYGIFFCLMAGIIYFTRDRHSKSQSQKYTIKILPYIVVLCIALGGFVSYFLIKDSLTGIEHSDSYNRPVELIVGLSDLQDIQFWTRRLYWLFLLFLPFLAFPLFYRKSWIYLLLPAAPISLILVSGFSQMQKPLDYWTAFPTLLIFLVAAMSLPKWRPEWRKQFPVGLAMLLIFIAYSWSGWKPLSIVRKYFTQDQALDLSPLRALPRDSKILLTDYSEGHFARISNRFHLTTLRYIIPDHKSFKNILDSFDYVVLNPEHRKITVYPPEIQKRLVLCKEAPKLHIYCRKGSYSK